MCTRFLCIRQCQGARMKKRNTDISTLHQLSWRDRQESASIIATYTSQPDDIMPPCLQHPERDPMHLRHCRYSFFIWPKPASMMHLVWPGIIIMQCIFLMSLRHCRPWEISHDLAVFVLAPRLKFVNAWSKIEMTASGPCTNWPSTPIDSSSSMR